MNQIKPRQDLVPLSEFRANVSELLKQAQLTGRPIIITQHGRGTGVLLSAEEYEKLVETIEVLRGVSRGQAEIAAGGGIPAEEGLKRLRNAIDRTAGQKAGARKRNGKSKPKDAA